MPAFAGRTRVKKLARRFRGRTQPGKALKARSHYPLNPRPFRRYWTGQEIGGFARLDPDRRQKNEALVSALRQRERVILETGVHVDVSSEVAITEHVDLERFCR
jgi:hypothetical protein